MHALEVVFRITQKAKTAGVLENRPAVFCQNPNAKSGEPTL